MVAVIFVRHVLVVIVLLGMSVLLGMLMVRTMARLLEFNAGTACFRCWFWYGSPNERKSDFDSREETEHKNGDEP